MGVHFKFKVTDCKKKNVTLILMKEKDIHIYSWTDVACFALCQWWKISSLSTFRWDLARRKYYYYYCYFSPESPNQYGACAPPTLRRTRDEIKFFSPRKLVSFLTVLILHVRKHPSYFSFNFEF